MEGNTGTGPVTQSVDSHLPQCNYCAHLDHCAIFDSQSLYGGNEEPYELRELPFDVKPDIFERGYNGPIPILIVSYFLSHEGQGLKI